MMRPGDKVIHRPTGILGTAVLHYGDDWWEFLPEERPARASLTCHETELAPEGENLEMEKLLWKS
jgi:hypothetical protein